MVRLFVESCELVETVDKHGERKGMSAESNPIEVNVSANLLPEYLVELSEVRILKTRLASDLLMESMMSHTVRCETKASNVLRCFASCQSHKIINFILAKKLASAHH